mmetsp:Transcript_11442/g.29067  ORF Transcript_11442/g.29067 Transcript_11442/m.29067 type:complete len:204 (-) Transcript_11442:178-789(-)
MRWTSRSAPVWASKRFVAMASISSMKTMAGAFSRARRKTSRTIRGPSPRYFWTNSDPTTEIKAAVVEFATALASIVFPVPGGPYMRTPRGGSIPICLYSSKWVNGSSTASRISCFCWSKPPIIAYVTVGFSVISWIVESDSGGRTSTTECEWRWSATDAFGLSFSRSMVDKIRTKYTDPAVDDAIPKSASTISLNCPMTNGTD